MCMDMLGKKPRVIFCGKLILRGRWAGISHNVLVWLRGVTAGTGGKEKLVSGASESTQKTIRPVKQPGKIGESDKKWFGQMVGI